MSVAERATGLRNLPPRVWWFGTVSFLNDAASEMVLPLLPALVTGALGGTAVSLGLIEGVASAVASVLKGVGGRLADRTGRHAAFVVGGYTLSNAVRPLMALAATAGGILALRVADRVGKGFREAPRDAMIAAVTPGAQRASAFSVHRAMDHAGTILGGGLAVLLIRELGWTPAQVFGWSVVPGICVVVAVLVAVRSGHAEPPRPVQAPPPARVAYGRLAPLLAVLALSRLGLASEMFLLLFAGRFVPLWGVPLLWAGLHAVKSAASAGAATLGRRLQPPQLAAAGWASHAMVFFGFAFAALRWDAVFSGSAAALSGAAARTTAVPEGAALAIVGLFAAWGLHAGLSEGAEKALVAGRAASEAQGTAFGAYHLVAGLAALPASLGFGWMWDTLGAAPAFALSGGCAGLAAVVLTISGVGRA